MRSWSSCAPASWPCGRSPGPTNSLGLVKLIFPNEYNVYLHSTPAQQLFAQSRRDFSHGCIRVEKADELAAWVLQGRPEWSLEKVREAMRSGKDNQQVNLPQPIPVLILYVTAVPAAGWFGELLRGYLRSRRKAAQGAGQRVPVLVDQECAGRRRDPGCRPRRPAWHAVRRRAVTCTGPYAPRRRSVRRCHGRKG